MTIREADIPKFLDGLKREAVHCEVTLRFQAGNITLVRVDRSYLTDKSHLKGTQPSHDRNGNRR